MNATARSRSAFGVESRKSRLGDLVDPRPGRRRARPFPVPWCRARRRTPRRRRRGRPSQTNGPVASTVSVSPSRTAVAPMGPDGPAPDAQRIRASVGRRLGGSLWGRDPKRGRRRGSWAQRRRRPGAGLAGLDDGHRQHPTWVRGVPHAGATGELVIGRARHDGRGDAGVPDGLPIAQQQEVPEGRAVREVNPVRPDARDQTAIPDDGLDSLVGEGVARRRLSGEGRWKRRSWSGGGVSQDTGGVSAYISPESLESRARGRHRRADVRGVPAGRHERRIRCRRDGVAAAKPNVRVASR